VGDVTSLLDAWSGGDQSAFGRLVPVVYDELRRSARDLLASERGEHTLQPTALIHEAYLRLVGQDRARWANRRHFLCVAACAMRRVLVDHARARQASKRGDGVAPAPLEEAMAVGVATDPALLELDQALSRLAVFDPRAAQVVELRYFGGFTDAETGDAIGISLATVKRDWTSARAWLLRELGRTG
jgi:RNA polymerase sigma factor (TIGR02999 family)